MEKTRSYSWVLSLFVMLFVVLPAQAEDFPGRALFPAVNVIELEDLYNRFQQFTIVDVRSRYEYDTLHIKGARHLPLSSPDFGQDIAQLRKQEGKPIVVYCNGRTCRKSYKAATKAMNAGVKDTLAFDAGILEWTRAYPTRAVLLGRSPVKPGELLSAGKFQDHLLSAAEFGKRIGDNTQVIDARDQFQRDAVGLFVGREIRVPFDDREGWKKQVAAARKSGKTLLIYDAVGKQVRWLQYFLEDHGLKSYFFMKNGAKGFYDNMLKSL
jgi:rhodanese-related sulfurtransferase